MCESMAGKVISKRLVTVSDVARSAGVSKATAARVLGNYSTVSTEVKDKVLEAAKKLGYQPNELARSMTTGKSNTIGVIVGDIENPYFGLAVRGISDAAASAGFDVVLSNSGEDLTREKAAVRVLLGKRVDGLIVAPSSFKDVEHLHEVQQSGRPLVLLDRTVQGLSVDAVVADDRQAALTATRTLIDAGHRRIAYISATVSDDPVYRGLHQIHLSTVMERIEGVLEASRAAGIESPEQYIRLSVGRRGKGEAIIADLLQGKQRPTAIIASDNLVALQVFKTLHQLGMNIPDDVSLIAFHDADWTSVTSPPITVVSQPVYELGFESAQVLLQRITDPSESPRCRVLSTHLIIRKSVAAPPYV
nr:LacI type transcriptional regulator [Agrobacterium tumefaciens]